MSSLCGRSEVTKSVSDKNLVRCTSCGWFAGGLSPEADLVLVKHTGIFEDVQEPFKSLLGDKQEVIEEYCPKCNGQLDALDMMAGMLDDGLPPDPDDNYCPQCDQPHPTKYCGVYWVHAGRGEYD